MKILIIERSDCLRGMARALAAVLGSIACLSSATLEVLPLGEIPKLNGFLSGNSGCYGCQLNDMQITFVKIRIREGYTSLKKSQNCSNICILRI